MVAWLLQMDRDLVVGDLNEQIDRFNAALGATFKVELCEIVSSMGRLVDLGILDEEKKRLCVKIMGEISRDYMTTLAEAMGMTFCEDATLKDMQETWPFLSMDDEELEEEWEDELYYEDDYG